MDDLEDLKARVAAAQEKLRLSADDQRKYGLRLNDVVTIVEGSLARQQDEMKRLQDSAVQLRLERDATRVAENQTKSLYEAALSRLNLLQSQNEQLRSMIMTLLNVIEGRESAGALQGVLQRLESTVHEIAAAAPIAAENADMPTTASAPASHADPIAEATHEVAEPVESAADQAADEAEIAQEESGLDADDVELAEDVPEEAPLEEPVEAAGATEDVIAEEASVTEAEADEGIAEDSITEENIAEESAGKDVAEAATAADQELTDDDQVTDLDLEDTAETAVLQPTAANSDDEELDLVSDDIPEDLGELSMKAHHDIVTDADAMVSDEGADEDEAETPAPAAKSVEQPAVNGKQDETLVTALLDAEKALIEAGASGVANANSPVAEIIRRISLRTREFSEASGV